MQPIARQLTFTYASAVVILFVLLLSAQILVQISLAQAVHVQDEYRAIRTQSIVTQRIIRNIILLLVPGDHTSTLASLLTDQSSFEETQPQILNPANNYPASVAAILARSTPSFTAVRVALRTFLDQEESGHPDNTVLRNAGSTIFYQGIVYFNITDQAASTLFTDAENTTGEIRYVEIGLFVCSLLTIIAEIIFVFIPAIRELQKLLERTHESRTT